MQHRFGTGLTPAHPRSLHPPLNRRFTTGFHDATANMVARLSERFVAHAMRMMQQVVQLSLTNLFPGNRRGTPCLNVGNDRVDLVIKKTIFLQRHPLRSSLASLAKARASHYP